MVSSIKVYKSRLVRVFAAIVLCVAVLFSATAPAFAASGMTGSQSSVHKGEAKLDKIYEESEDALRNPPLSLEQVRDKANEGLNEVQGAADAKKMNRPSNSQAASSIEERIENALEKVTDKS